MSTDITPYVNESLEARMQYVKTLASGSSMIPTALHENGVPSPGKILVVTETGAMLGLHPMAALAGIHVIEGKAAISAGLMSALVRAAGFKLRVHTEGSVKVGDYQVTATLIRPDDPDNPFVATWSQERAARAGLLGKDNWKKYFEAMAKARAISEVCREGAEDVLKGIHYTPEELQVDVTDAGELVPVKDAPPAEDWLGLISRAETKAEITAIVRRVKQTDEAFVDEVQTAALTRMGMLNREAEAQSEPNPTPTPVPVPEPVEEVVDGEVVDDEPSEDDPIVEPTSWPVRTIPTQGQFAMDTPPFGGDAA